MVIYSFWPNDLCEHHAHCCSMNSSPHLKVSCSVTADLQTQPGIWQSHCDFFFPSLLPYQLAQRVCKANWSYEYLCLRITWKVYLKSVSTKLIIMRGVALDLHVFDYNGFNGKNDCLKCQRKKLTAQREEVCWVQKYYFTKFHSEWSWILKNARKIIEQKKDLTL